MESVKYPIWPKINNQPTLLLPNTASSSVFDFVKNLENQNVKRNTKTSIVEMRTFLEINLLMSIKRPPPCRDYWSSAPKLRSSAPKLQDDFCSGNIINLMRFGWLLAH